MTTFLGMPVHAPRGVGQLRAEEPFPVAARRALADSQLRRNIGHATQTIREKRARVVGEVPDWEELRIAGQQVKAATMARLDEHLERLEREVTKNGALYTLMGGAFNTQSEDGASCDFTFFSVDQAFKLFDMGFRCCFDVNPL